MTENCWLGCKESNLAKCEQPETTLIASAISTIEDLLTSHNFGLAEKEEK